VFFESPGRDRKAERGNPEAGLRCPWYRYSVAVGEWIYKTGIKGLDRKPYGFRSPFSSRTGPSLDTKPVIKTVSFVDDDQVVPAKAFRKPMDGLVTSNARRLALHARVPV